MTLQALREKIGTKPMLHLLRRWASGTATAAPHRPVHRPRREGRRPRPRQSLPALAVSSGASRDAAPPHTASPSPAWRRCSSLAAAAPAGAKPARAAPAAKVAVGHATISAPTSGRAAILVPVHYPIDCRAGWPSCGSRCSGARGRTIHSWVLHERSGARLLRVGDQRRRFTFVHRVGTERRASAGRLREGSRCASRQAASSTSTKTASRR